MSIPYRHILEARCFRHLHARNKFEPWVMLDRNDPGDGWDAYATYVGIIPRTGQHGVPMYRHSNADPVAAVMRLVEKIRRDFPLYQLTEEFGQSVAAYPLLEERDGTLWYTPGTPYSFVPSVLQLQEWDVNMLQRHAMVLSVGTAGAVHCMNVIWKAEGEAYALRPTTGF